VNLDGVVSAADALAIINQLNGQTAEVETDERIVLVMEGFTAFLPPPCSCGGTGCPACVGSAVDPDLADVTTPHTPNFTDETSQLSTGIQAWN
jgi:hypothetical protein